MRRYKEEELESMNFILGKEKENKIFSKFELEAMSNIDLFNRKVVNICKLIWDSKDDEEKLDEILKVLKEAQNNAEYQYY